MSQTWSWVLALAEITFLGLCSRTRVYGLLLMCVLQLAWIIYATHTHQYGFYLIALVHLLAFGLQAHRSANPSE